MSEAEVIDVMKSGLWVAFAVSLPILSVTLVVGTLIGLFQALTSVQELTLTFVPKLAAIVIVYWLSMGFMTETVVDFFQRQIITRIESGGFGG